MSDTIQPKGGFLVIGNHYWGRGNDLATAKKNFREQGGQMSKGYTILEFGPDQEFMGVDPVFGQVSWKNDDGSDREPKATEVKPKVSR